MSQSHDQDFKNLIVDYPRQALAFFAADEAMQIDAQVTITPVRQEMPKDRLSDRFHELDVPLLVKWPDGRREALLFVLEEETDPNRFSILRLGVYCLQLARLCKTDRVVPVVIFLKGNERVPSRLTLGGDRHKFLRFRYLRCVLNELPVRQYLASRNIVARICLPYMAGADDDKVEVFHATNSGIEQFEPDPNRQDKYREMANRNLDLSDEELQEYARRYPKESAQMAGVFQRKWEEGMQSGLAEGIRQGVQQGIEKGIEKGIEQGLRQGSRVTVERLLRLRFGELDATAEARLQTATQAELDLWVERILTARTLDEVFGVQ